MKYLERFWELWGFIPFYHILSPDLVHYSWYNSMIFNQFNRCFRIWLHLSSAAFCMMPGLDARTGRPIYVVIRSMTHIQSEHMWTPKMIRWCHNVTTSETACWTSRVAETLHSLSYLHTTHRSPSAMTQVRDVLAQPWKGWGGWAGLQQFLWKYGLVWK